MMDLIVWMAVRCSGDSCGARHVLCPSQCVFCGTGICNLCCGYEAVFDEMESLLLLSEGVHSLSPLFHPEKWCPPAISMLIEIAMKF